MPNPKRHIVTFIKKAYGILIVLALLLLAGDISAQSKSDTYLFHFSPFKDEKPAGAPHARRVKVRLDYGLVSQFIITDPHYTSSLETDGAYTLGLMLDIPVLQNSNILVGGNFMDDMKDEMETWGEHL